MRSISSLFWSSKTEKKVHIQLTTHKVNIPSTNNQPTGSLTVIHTKSAACLPNALPPEFRRKSVRSWCDGASDRSFMVDPLSYFSLQPVFHDWCNKGRGMCYPVCGMVHIKERLLLIGNSSPCGGSEFPLSLSEWSFTICSTPYNRK